MLVDLAGAMTWRKRGDIEMEKKASGQEISTGCYLMSLLGGVGNGRAVEVSKGRAGGDDQDHRHDDLGIGDEKNWMSAAYQGISGARSR